MRELKEETQKLVATTCEQVKPEEAPDDFGTFDPLEELAEMLDAKKKQRQELEDKLFAHDAEIMALELAVEALKKKVS